MQAIYMKQPETICEKFLKHFENPVLVHDAAIEEREGHEYDVLEGVTSFAFPTRRSIDLTCSRALMSFKEYKAYAGAFISKLVAFIKDNPDSTIIVPTLGAYGKGAKNIFGNVLQPMLWDALGHRDNVVLLWDK